ncbi:MAG: hypothetical protein ACHP78_13860 [Terriglobales bacterium]
MRKFCWLAVLLSFCGCEAGAQDSPKGELFAGYSYLHVGSPGGTNDSVPAGLNLDATRYFFHGLGVTASFEFHHKQDYGPGQSATVLALVGGPRFKARYGKFEPFAHVLVGETRVGLSYVNKVPPLGSPLDNDFGLSTKLGGGLDVAASRHWLVRVAELNYYRTGFSGGAGFSNTGAPERGMGFSQNNFTFSAGVVLRWQLSGDSGR